MLRLKTLGGLSVQRDDAPLSGAATQRRRLALLALLARTGERGLSRDKILGYLWPDSDPEKGRNVLAQALYALRRDLGAEQLFLGTTDLRLNPEAITSDAAEFCGAVSAGRLEEAVTLYAGPFLDGIYIAEAPEFERWAETERTGLAHDYRSALERLAARAEAAGDHRSAVGWWRKLAAVDPLSTRVALGLMHALAASGDRAGAIQHARVYEAMLRQELDAAPDAEVVRLAERLRQESVAPAPVERSIPSPASPPQATATTPTAAPAAASPAAAEPLPAAAPSTVVPGSAPASAPPAAAPPKRPRLTPRHLSVAIGGAMVLFLLVGVMLIGQRFAASRGGAAGGRKVIAVLPFRNLGKPEDEYFADGLTEEVTSRLTTIDGLRVISRSSSMQYKETAKPLREVARELGATYVLEGSVRWERLPGGTSRVRVTPQLIQVSDDSYLWADRYDASLADVFEVQGKIAEEVASELDVKLGGRERATLAARPTDNLEAYAAYLRAGGPLDRAWDNIAAIDTAIAGYENVVRLDPSFADAWARLSIAHSLKYRRGHDQTDARLARAKAAADSAFRIDPRLTAGHLALGFYYYWGRREYDRARAEFLAVRQRQPSDAEALYGLGAVERRQGRWADAVTHLCLGADLDPRSTRKAWDCGLAAFFTRDYPTADRYLDRSIALDSTSSLAYSAKARLQMAWHGDTAGARRVLDAARGRTDPAGLAGGVYEAAFLLAGPSWYPIMSRLTIKEFDDSPVDYFVWQGSWRHARREPAMERAAWDSLVSAGPRLVRESPTDDQVHAGLAVAYAGLGRKDEALREMDRAEALLPYSRDPAWGADRSVLFAQACARLGDVDRAVRRLQQLLSIAAPISPAWLRVDPAYDPIRSDPRFQRLLRGR